MQNFSIDATAKTRDLSFGRSEKSAFRNFSVVTLQAATLKIPKRVFFRNRGKILRRGFGSRVRSRSNIIIFHSHHSIRNDLIESPAGSEFEKTAPVEFAAVRKQITFFRQFQNF